MKIQYGIAGFAVGILAGLLVGVIELKLIKRLQLDAAIPFVIGITVIGCAITGVITGLRIFKRS